MLDLTALWRNIEVDMHMRVNKFELGHGSIELYHVLFIGCSAVMGEHGRVNEQCGIEHCTFDYMKKNAPSLSPEYNGFFSGGLTNFVFKGTNDRWHDTLTAEDVEKYERHASENLTPDCAHWLAMGERRD
jgi:hypothetical protein